MQQRMFRADPSALATCQRAGRRRQAVAHVGAPLVPTRLALLASLAVAATLGAARAADFRIHTKVYADAGKTPVSENVTIFHAGLAYDFREDPAEVVVFDPAGGRFVLLQPQRKELAEISLDRIDAFLAALEQRLIDRKDEYSVFLTKPTFRAAAGDQPGEAAFTAPWMQYQVQAIAAPDDAAAAQYAAFSAHCTRLNALRRPALLARAPVNDWLRERKLIPQSVRLSTYSKNAGGEMVREAEYRSEHVVSRELARGDLDRLSRLAPWQADFQRVSLTAYWGVADQQKQ